VVEAEVLAADGGRAAAVSVGEDVAAEIASFWVDGGLLLHGGPPRVLVVQSIFSKAVIGG
jgi:hypothetical protein